MAEQFPVIEIPSDAREEDETMGTKEKFWFRNRERELCLYKKSRPNTGEDWSEKIASELCVLLGLPHAEYELATFNGECGIISPSFVPKDGELILGNEILVEIISDYPQNYSNPSQHTLKNVFSAIRKPSVNLPINWTPIDGINTAQDIFIGYLLLDTWIGNTDRHHENWAFIRIVDQTYLAPTYDHASSLGRNEPDDKRQQRLITKDAGFSVKAYVEKCKSCLYAKVGDKKPLNTFDAFRKAAGYNANAAYTWLESLAKISTTDTLELFHRIPNERISSKAIDFAQEILKINRIRLLELKNILRLR